METRSRWLWWPSDGAYGDRMGMVVVYLLVIWLVCIVIGTAYGAGHGSAMLGFLLPFAFGPIGLALALVLLTLGPVEETPEGPPDQAVRSSLS